MPGYEIHVGDCTESLRAMPAGSMNCCVTSPPYWGLRDYGHEGQYGLEPSLGEFLENMVEVFALVHRALADDGTLWRNMGDSDASGRGTGHQGKHGQRAGRSHTQRSLLGKSSASAGIKAKDLVGQPWRLAFALQDWGWYLRQDIIWHKPNPMPESVQDRCTKAHEYIFLLSKSPQYYYDHEAIKEPANLTGKGNANGFRGGAYVGGSTFDNSNGGNRTARGNVGAVPVPACWDTEQGGHGTIHKDGRTSRKRPSKPKGPFSGKTEAMAGTGQNAIRAVTDTRNKRSGWTVASQPV